MLRFCLILVFFVSCTATAGPIIAPGDLILRHDVQRLADAGIITGPTTTWPLAWGPILADIERADPAQFSPAVADALTRVKRRAQWETRTGELRYDAEIGIADNATRIRSYEDTPRGRAEASVGANWTGDRISADINVQYVDSVQDSDEVRVDGSEIAVALGNWSIAASTMDRWWGPGWDGSLIMSNNARPVPSLVIDRVFTDRFETKWLSWLGPWDFTMLFGQLEEERAIPNAQLFGMRFNFRPLPSLEIGLSRTAQWCGDGRPCDLETFIDLFTGRDNADDDDTDRTDEPGNQLAGFDVRWTPGFMGSAFGLYGQLIGEDEAGGFPSRHMGQVGADWSGYLFDRWSTRAFIEFAGTTCQFHESSKLYNCAYNHGIYKTGYRFRGRAIGHGADNDAELISVGLALVDAGETQWRALLRAGTLNAGGAPDSANTLTATSQDLLSMDLAHSRAYWFGVLELGVGYESIDDEVSGSSSGEGRVYLQWRSSY